MRSLLRGQPRALGAVGAARQWQQTYASSYKKNFRGCSEFSRPIVYLSRKRARACNRRNFSLLRKLLSEQLPVPVTCSNKRVPQKKHKTFGGPNKSFPPPHPRHMEPAWSHKKKATKLWRAWKGEALFSKSDIARRGASTIGEFKRRGRGGKRYCNLPSISNALAVWSSRPESVDSACRLS